MFKRLTVLFSAILLFPLLTTQAEAKCAAFPNVSWWGKLTHGGVKIYVSQKHGGEWAGYLEKWSRQLANVKTIYGQGNGIKIPSTGVTLKGLQLSDYIDKLSQRVNVNECLSKEKSPAASTTTTKVRKKVIKVTPFGKGVAAYRASDFKIAHDIWLPLANDGNAKAQNALGHLYRKGYGVEPDLAISRRWYSKSAASGDKVGLYSLGDIIRTSAASQDDMAKAIILIKKSANLNYGVAQNALAELLHQGKNLAANDAQAYFWILLAQKNNYKKAQILKDILDKSLSATEKKSQSQRALKWLKKVKK
jgi:TPR repeat protein